jgi:hypothetical protein
MTKGEVLDELSNYKKLDDERDRARNDRYAIARLGKLIDKS